MSANIDIQKPRHGWNSVMSNRSTSRSSSPIKTSIRDLVESPGMSNSRPSVMSRNSVSSIDGDGVRRNTLKRKDSVKVFGDLVMLGEIQNKMNAQGKLLQMKAQARKDTITKGGVKKILNAPKVLKAFRSQISVSLMFCFVRHTLFKPSLNMCIIWYFVSIRMLYQPLVIYSYLFLFICGGRNSDEFMYLLVFTLTVMVNYKRTFKLLLTQT